jgi:hypothetical protein
MVDGVRGLSHHPSEEGEGMSATDAPGPSTATPGTVDFSARHSRTGASSRDEVRATRSLLGDVRVGSLLLAEGRRRAVTRAFGVPRDEQSLLVTIVLTGAAAGVLRGLVPRRPHLSGADVAIGGSLINATFRGIAGAPSQSMPLAGAMIAFALAAHAIRPAVSGTVREVRIVAHGVRATFSARYGPRPSQPPAATTIGTP